MLSTDKLKNKEVINMRDGRSLGFIYDIEVNLEKGTIDGVVKRLPHFSQPLLRLIACPSSVGLESITFVSGFSQYGHFIWHSSS